MAKKYYSMNEVPAGTKMIVKSTGEEVILLEVQNFPTTFVVQSESGERNKYSTHQVDIIGWPEEE